MKKLFLFAVALTGLLAASCTREKDIPVAIEREMGPTHTVSIKASIEPGTRTSYADDKTFSWEATDSIIVLTLSPDEEYVRLAVFYAQSAGPETIFSGEVEDGYTLYSLAFYTATNSYVTFGDEGDNNIYYNLPTFTFIDGDSEVYYTAESANPLENLPLIGVQMEDGSYLFRTLTGAAKFTFTDIPEGASYFAIEGSSEPLSGHFTWDEEGVLTMETGRPATVTVDGKGNTQRTYHCYSYILYHFERNADGTGTVYMPLPVGEIPAGAMVSFYSEDEDHNPEELLYTRPLRAPLPIERNKVTEIASFRASYDWESMGTGAFFDAPVFVNMTAEEDQETDDILLHLAQVEFFRDKNMPGVYRFENPYKKAAEFRGYTIDPDYEKEMDDYLMLTVLKDNTIVYDDFYTGYKYSGTDQNGKAYNSHIFAGCPLAWGDDNSFNFVAKYNEEGVPTNAVLSSLYLYEWNNLYYYWNGAWADSWNFMWTTVLFPDWTEQLDLYCDVSMAEMADDTPAHPTAKVEVELGDDIVGAYLVIAQDQETAEEMIAAGKATLADATGNYTAPFPEDAPSGTYYAFAKTIPAEGLTPNCAHLFQGEEEYDYFRTDMDRELTMEDIVGTYRAMNYYFTATIFKQSGRAKYGWTDSEKRLSLVIEESDNPLSGDIMFTDICPEIVKSFAGSVTATPVYGWFDMATGVITIDPGQTAYTAGSNFYTVADIDGEAVSMYLQEPGVVYCKNNIAFLKNGAMGALPGVSGTYPEAWTNTETTFTRSGTSAAPAKAPARREETRRPHTAGRIAPSLTNPVSARRPVQEAVPFPGHRDMVTVR